MRIPIIGAREVFVCIELIYALIKNYYFAYNFKCHQNIREQSLNSYVLGQVPMVYARTPVNAHSHVWVFLTPLISCPSSTSDLNFSSLDMVRCSPP